MKMLTYISAAIAAMLVAASCTEKPAVDTKVLKLSPEEVDLYPGSKLDIQVTEQPDAFDMASARWSTSDNTVALVDGGRVTAVAVGDATISLGYRDMRASMTVHVIAKPIELESILVDPGVNYLKPGETTTLKVAVTPTTYTTSATTAWSSSNEAVAKVSADGKITAVAVGTSVITASLEGKTATAKVHVYNESETKTFTLFQLNVWEDLVDLTGGASVTRQAFYDLLCELKPDVATFCELNSGNQILGAACSQLLDKTGVQYYHTELYGSGGRGMLSSFPVVEGASSVAAVKGGTNSWFYRMVVNIYGQEVALYASHSYYANYACYWPRGYDGVTWKKMDAAITDVEKILEEELKSGRQNIADDFIADSQTQAGKGRLCVFAGDLNEPSHLDWVESTKDLYEHNGCVVTWPISERMYNNGVKDAFREIWPDPTVNYGLTWPVSNPDAVKDTQWAYESDDRDRIDYVYYKVDTRLKPISAKMVGPKETIAFSKVVTDVTNDDYIVVPKAKWPSDHRGLLVTFEIEVPKVVE